MPDDCSHRLASVSRGTGYQFICPGVLWCRVKLGSWHQAPSWAGGPRGCLTGVWWPDPSLGRPAERGVRKIDKKRRGGALRGSPCQRGPTELDYADPRTAHSSITASQHSASYLLQQVLGWSPGAPVIGVHGVGLLCHSCFCVPFALSSKRASVLFPLLFLSDPKPLLVSWSHVVLGNKFLVARYVPRQIP